jgi:hypothetical protein
MDAPVVVVATHLPAVDVVSVAEEGASARNKSPTMGALEQFLRRWTRRISIEIQPTPALSR